MRIPTSKTKTNPPCRNGRAARRREDELSGLMMAAQKTKGGECNGFVGYQVRRYHTARSQALHPALKKKDGAPVTVYRSSSGQTYSSRHVRTWGDLSKEQKKAAYVSAYHQSLADAKWSIAKDPGLQSQYDSWVEALQKELDASLRSIDVGDEVPPPRKKY